MLPLTARQQQILDLVRVSLRDRHYAPTVRELQAATGITNPNGIMCHLRALRKKGLLTWTPGEGRTLRPVRGPWTLPLLGTVRSDGRVDFLEKSLAVVEHRR